MTIKDVKADKKKFEETIRQLILDFESRTHTYVDEIEVEYHHDDEEWRVNIKACI